MTVSTKIISKLALQVQESGAYEDDAMQLIPLLSGRIKQKPNLIEDESFSGNAFRDIPQRGTISVEGTFSFQIDPVSLAPILEAALGIVNTGAYTMAQHAKKLSMVCYDGVNTIEYNSIFVKTLKISGSSGNKLMGEITVVGISAEIRSPGDNFPAATSYGEFFTFNEASGLGFLRVSGISTPLTSADNEDFDDFSIDITTGFDAQFCNQRFSLIPVFGMSAPSVAGSFKIARYEDDKYLDYHLNTDRLQLNLYFVKGVAESIEIEIPNFIIDAEITDDDVARITANMTVGRNGIGTTYKNANMAFVSPIRITLEG